MRKKVLITGANGYVGRNLIKRLLKENYQLVSLARNLGKMPAWLLGSSNLTVVEGDLADKKSLKKAVEGVDVVFHLAAALRMFEKNGQIYQTNIAGLKNFLSVCRQANRRLRFIFASSIDAGNRETDYAKSKLEGEEITKKFCLRNPQIKYTIVRIGNIYGGKEGGMVEGIRKIMSKNNWQSSILYHCLGNEILYLVEMKNLVRKLAELAFDSEAKNKTFTLVDEKLKVQDLVKRLKKQKLIVRYPNKLFFASILLQVWQFLGKVFKRGDLLVYLSMQK